jgi:hypothetical protein
LFYANTLWLGPLSESDARWSMARFMERKGVACSEWTEETLSAILKLSWGYPSFLRAMCEAHAAGCSLEIEALKAHAAVQRRVAEFWSDPPSPEDLRSSGLEGHPLLGQNGEPPAAVPNELTAKEALLLAYFQAHPHEICEKDDLIRAVWPEDRIFSEGIRDDSLAQIIRRLRRKIEPDPANPRFIHSVIGRGYRYMPVK